MCVIIPIDFCRNCTENWIIPFQSRSVSFLTHHNKFLELKIPTVDSPMIIWKHTWKPNWRVRCVQRDKHSKFRTRSWIVLLVKNIDKLHGKNGHIRRVHLTDLVFIWDDHMWANVYRWATTTWKYHGEEEKNVVKSPIVHPSSALLLYIKLNLLRAWNESWKFDQATFEYLFFRLPSPDWWYRLTLPRMCGHFKHIKNRT